jgi:hypothetical protein
MVLVAQEGDRCRGTFSPSSMRCPTSGRKLNIQHNRSPLRTGYAGTPTLRRVLVWIEAKTSTQKSLRT